MNGQSRDTGNIGRHRTLEKTVNDEWTALATEQDIER